MSSDIPLQQIWYSHESGYEDGGCVEYETSSQLLTQDDYNVILQSNMEYEQINGKWFTSIKHEH